MWFQLLLPLQTSTLSVLVGRDGKIYFRLVDVAALLSKNGVYSFAKRFQSVTVQGTDVLPFHKDYPIVTKKTHLVPPNVVYNILAAENVSLSSSFAKPLNMGYAFVPPVKQLLVESFKKSPVLIIFPEGASITKGTLVRKWIQAFMDKAQQQRCLEAQYSDMVYVPPEEATLERSPEIIPLSFPETMPERRPASVETVPTLPAPGETVPEPSLLRTLLTRPAPVETVSEPSPPEPILLKPVEKTPLLPTHRKRPLETPPCSLPNKIVKSEPSEEEDVRLLLKAEAIETTQMTHKVGDFVMLYPNHPPKIWWVKSDQTQLIRVVYFVTLKEKNCMNETFVTNLCMV
ncbi:uncharacterized protein NPIL_106691 [Nephila pilipes]|uniref:Phospholipid/glycerol acyltransferase domain-containing protein n=1 Tax=Nephila pilipes TaxID=299642 RepID=A0A8X6U5L3_NEPPI|nr:uncharacterized protein NPIL_106691 [Nephila pilipes]